eukprot:1524704-Amphidinium_carterae.1
MGPRVLGFSYPGHRFPPRPVQPGLGTIGPAKPKSVVTKRSRCPLCARVAGGMGTWARTHPDTPARPN